MWDRAIHYANDALATLSIVALAIFFIFPHQFRFRRQFDISLLLGEDWWMAVTTVLHVTQQKKRRVKNSPKVCDADNAINWCGIILKFVAVRRFSQTLIVAAIAHSMWNWKYCYLWLACVLLSSMAMHRHGTYMLCVTSHDPPTDHWRHFGFSFHRIKFHFDVKTHRAMKLI